MSQTIQAAPGCFIGMTFKSSQAPHNAVAINPYKITFDQYTDVNKVPAMGSVDGGGNITPNFFWQTCLGPTGVVLSIIGAVDLNNYAAFETACTMGANLQDVVISLNDDVFATCPFATVARKLTEAPWQGYATYMMILMGDWEFNGFDNELA